MSICPNSHQVVKWTMFNSYSLPRAIQNVTRKKDFGEEGDSWNSGRKALAPDSEHLTKM